MTLRDLQKEAEVLGLKVEPSKARAPYLEALRAHFLKRDFPNGLPYEELTPMLCFDFWSLDPKHQKSLWKSHDWAIQQKLNGVRLILHFVKGMGVFAHSRTVSVHTYRRTELTDRLLFGSHVPDFTATVDCEVVAGNLQQSNSLLHARASESLRLQKETPLKLYVFDLIKWEQTDLRLRKLAERLSFMPDFQAAITKAQLASHFAYPPIVFQGKKAVFDKILAEGGEGIVFKNLNFAYIDSNSRSCHGWVKLKRQIELEAYVSGFEVGKSGSKWEGYVATLSFSVNTEKNHLTIAKVSNLPWQFRKEISIRDRSTGSVKMDIAVYGRVAHITGLEISRKARRLVHPAIDFWRSDLTQEQCVYSMSDIEAVRKGQTGISLTRVVSDIKNGEADSHIQKNKGD